jgi:hypothetical protein
MTPVAAVTPASPNRAVAASVTNAVAAMFTTLPERGDSGSDHAKNQLCNCESFQLLEGSQAIKPPNHHRGQDLAKASTKQQTTVNGLLFRRRSIRSANKNGGEKTSNILAK